MQTSSWITATWSQKRRAGGSRAGVFKFDPLSVGATINVLLAAVTAKGPSRLENAAAEPDVVVFGNALKKMGAQISGLGTSTIEVQGVPKLKPVDFPNCPDRIELGTYMIAAAIAGKPGDTITLTEANADQLGAAFREAFEATGTEVEYRDDSVLVTVPEVIRPVSIETAPFPGFPTDLQAQWTVMMTQAQGNSSVTDTIYRDRFKHIPELRRMGANCITVDNHVVIEGNKDQRIQGATVMSTDLRASVSLVLAGMVAEGTTEVLRIYHLDRGYERLELKLQRAGIKIEREEYQEMPD